MTFRSIQFTFVTGQDGLRSNSDLWAELRTRTGAVISKIKVKEQGEAGWDSGGTKETWIYSIPDIVDPDDIYSVELALKSHNNDHEVNDEWEIVSLGIYLRGGLASPDATWTEQELPFGSKLSDYRFLLIYRDRIHP